MRRLSVALIAAASGIAFTQIVSAADLPVKPPEAPVVAPVSSWTGFYIGGDIGWANAQQSATTLGSPSPGFGAPAIIGAGALGYGMSPTSHDLDDDSFLGGLHLGYNWQTGIWVFGIEGDFIWLDRKNTDLQATSLTCCAGFGPYPVQLSASNDWLASLRGRLGIAYINNFLFYATGGAAWTKIKYNVQFTLGPDAAFPGGASATANFDKTSTGFVVGGGAEWMFAPQWSVRLEYLYYNFDGVNGNAPLVGGTVNCGTSCSFNAEFSDLNIHSLRAGLSYKF